MDNNGANDVNDGEDLFSAAKVRELDNEDFYLKSSHRIALNASGCSAILFYFPNNPASRSMKALWNRLSSELAGVNFFAVNMARRTAIMQAFARVQADKNHDLNQFQIRGSPTILVYRETMDEGISLPQAFYNGTLSYTALLNYFLTLACEAGYREYPNAREGAIIDDSDNYYVTDNRIPKYDEYGNKQPPLSSLNFTDEGMNLQDVAENAAFNERNQYLYDEDALEMESERPPQEFSLRRFFSAGNANSGAYDDPGVFNFLDN